MTIEKTASAGTLESSDILVTVEKGEPKKGVVIKLTSSVSKQFGKQIKMVITECAQTLGFEDLIVTAVDSGALDCTIKARVKTAIYRACGSTDYVWEA